MINMRIDVIRKELERRFREVEKLKNQGSDKIEDAISKFLHFLLTEPSTKGFILGLSHFDEDYLQSNDYKQVKIQATKAIKVIVSEIDKAGFVDDDFKEGFMAKYRGLGNPFDLPHPDIGDEYLTIDQYLHALRNFESYSDDIVNGLESVIITIDNIFQYAANKVKSCDIDKVRTSYDQLQDCIIKLEAYLKYKAEYDGASYLLDLLIYYKISRYWYLSGLKMADFGREIKDRSTEGKFASYGKYLVEACKNVYHAVDKFLMTSKSKSALIDRLKTYCMWIRREDFPKPGEENIESRISKIVTEFIFNHGYFPVVNPKMGKGIPDILTEPSGVIRWDNSVLIELKQAIGGPYTNSKLEADIGQARDYLTTVKGVKPDVADVVYLLIFYDGSERFGLDKSFSDKLFSEDNVQVEFIYVGEKSPSKLKKSKILGE